MQREPWTSQEHRRNRRRLCLGNLPYDTDTRAPISLLSPQPTISSLPRHCIKQLTGPCCEATNLLDDLSQISRLRVSPVGMSSRFPPQQPWLLPQAGETDTDADVSRPLNRTMDQGILTFAAEWEAFAIWSARLRGRQLTRGQRSGALGRQGESMNPAYFSAGCIPCHYH